MTVTTPTPTDEKPPATATDSKKKTKKKKKTNDTGAAPDAAGRKGSETVQPFLRRRNRKKEEEQADTSIPFKDIQEELDKIPVTKKGEIYEDDLEAFAEKIVRHKRDTGRQRKFFFISLSLSGVLLLALFGLIILAITVAKDTSVNKDGALVATNKAETPITVHGDNGIRIHADTTPMHSIPMRRARRLFRRMLSEEDEFEDGDTVALVNKSEVDATFEAVVNNDNGVHVDFEYLGNDFNIKLGTDAMIRATDGETDGFSIQNLQLNDYEELHQVSVVCPDGSDECDVVAGSETTNELIRRLQKDYRRNLLDGFHRSMQGPDFPRTAECYDCGPDKGEYGLCREDNDEECSFCECAAVGKCTHKIGDEVGRDYREMGRDSRGSSAAEREQICETEIFPSGTPEHEARMKLLQKEKYSYGFISKGDKCRYCYCGHNNCDMCFSPDSSVQTKDRGAVLMKELQLGDSVLTSSGRYKMVQAFQTHNLPAPNKEAQYLKIVTDVGNEIVMTPRHMIFRCEDRSHPVPASMVKEGDCLVVVQKDSNKDANQSVAFQADAEAETEANVVRIEQVFASGGISPLTEDGTIVVDGIVASCYSNPEGERDAYVRVFGVTTPIHRHTLTHTLFTPVLHFCDRVSSIPCVGFWNSDDAATLPSKMPIDVWFTYFHRSGFTHFFFVMIVLALLQTFLGGARNTAK